MENQLDPLGNILIILEIIDMCFITPTNKIPIIEINPAPTIPSIYIIILAFSDDIKIIPKEHVRDDAGNSSSAITDKYIDI